ncbi:MAG: cation:dicarboxylase symporter family transporter [Deltaproteobacteria bacterium]|nr:MAG: cation:dicarboxylase symporter family transporter [Deltaproteobacteria bacterium]
MPHRASCSDSVASVSASESDLADRARTRRLYLFVLIAIVLGVVVGLVAPETAAKQKSFGDGFIKLIKMTIAPLIFCTVVTGIARMKTLKEVGKVGAFALLYFEIMSTIALIIGLVVINVIKPGVGMNVDATKLDTSGIKQYIGESSAAPTPSPAPAAPAAPPRAAPAPAAPASGATATAAPSAGKPAGKPAAPPASSKLTVKGFLLEIIPDTFVGAFTHGDILPVLLLALLFGFALHHAGERGKPITDLVDRFGHVMFGIVRIIMYAAPLGAFGAMAATVGASGIGVLVSLGALMACFYATCLLFVFVVLGVVARLTGFSIFRFVRYIRDELFLVLGTSSSESALPRLIARLEALGAGKPVVGLVIPTGYSFNLDGTSIYLTMAAVFVAQATNTPLDLSQQIELLIVLLLTSKGAAGVTGSGFIVLAATLGAVGNVPLAGLAVILGIDRFMSEARALTNIIGNGVATLVVARLCNDLDVQRMRNALSAPPPDPDPEQIPTAQVAHPGAPREKP